MNASADLAIVGAGAAGLMCAISAARTSIEQPAGAGRRARIVALDGATKLGAKILVAGGGRCNVTHHAVDASAYAGASRNAVNKVLRSFTVADTLRFFEELGVTLKREDTGKLFPTTDSAKTVLQALLRGAQEAGAELIHPWRAEQIEKADDGFVVINHAGECLHARRVVLATGGLSLPKTGSDGTGYQIARSLGHTVTRTFPALVPLKLGGHDDPIKACSGISTDAVVEVRAATGKRLARFEGAVLCTHFGLSGPAVLDVSRHLLAARHEDAGAGLFVNWTGQTPETLDARLSRQEQRSAVGVLAEHVPERLAAALCERAAVEPRTALRDLRREDRKRIVESACSMEVQVSGSRGYLFAEVTAGGVPLGEVDLRTMESRVTPGLHLCGEILDVDGRIGGFNFQWAWATGWLAGRGARVS